MVGTTNYEEERNKIERNIRALNLDNPQNIRVKRQLKRDLDRLNALIENQALRQQQQQPEVATSKPGSGKKHKDRAGKGSKVEPVRRGRYNYATRDERKREQIEKLERQIKRLDDTQPDDVDKREKAMNELSSLRHALHLEQQACATARSSCSSIASESVLDGAKDAVSNENNNLMNTALSQYDDANEATLERQLAAIQRCIADYTGIKEKLSKTSKELKVFDIKYSGRLNQFENDIREYEQRRAMARRNVKQEMKLIDRVTLEILAIYGRVNTLTAGKEFGLSKPMSVWLRWSGQLGADVVKNALYLLARLRDAGLLTRYNMLRMFGRA